MKKPILATTLSGLFLKKEAWDNAHRLWYADAAKALHDSSVNQWANRPDYFKGVDEVMQRLYPNATETERTVKARRMFFDSVIKYIKENPSMKNDKVITYFKSLKRKYRIALVTTNTRQALEKILSATGLQNLFDIVEASEESEKDDKIAVFNRFTKTYGNPLVYIGGDRKDSFDYCKAHKIPHIFANLEDNKEIEGIESVHNLDELKTALSRFI